MNNNKRPVIAVITARTCESEQKQILSGILPEAERIGANVIVISNVYNFSEYHADVEIENKIYELIDSEQIDGIIVVAESIYEPGLRKKVFDAVLQRKGTIPIVFTGAEIEGCNCIDTDARSDFKDITRHLTDIHGFTKFDVLTGQEFYETSHHRVDGVKDVLSEKGIELSDDNIIFGDFWMTSGEKLAMEYINGERNLPEAVICCNDYMAYGLIDKFFDNDVYMPKDVTVVGYEYVGGRIYHYPILTTYLRNRPALGKKAVNIINAEFTGTEPDDIIVKGHMVTGCTCACGFEKQDFYNDMNSLKKDKYYNDMNFCGNFEQQAAVCRSLKDYIRCLQDFSHLVRNVDGIYLCLYENWCSEHCNTVLDVNSNDETMVCYRVISPENGSDEPRFFKRSCIAPEDLPGSSGKGFYYIVPMFSGSKELGHIILQYLTPDVYDMVFIDWLKTAVNALCSLRLKNDINSLLECRNLSEFHDSPTGLYNRSGLLNEISAANKNLDENNKLMLILIRTGLFYDDSKIDNKSTSVRIDTELAENFKRLITGQNEYCAKISDKLFVLAALGDYTEKSAEILIDKLNAVICHSPIYSTNCGIESTVIISSITTPDKADEEITALTKKINASIVEISHKYENSQYNKFIKMRNDMYTNPCEEWNAQDACRDFHLSYGHFRATYKDLFGVSFHQDFISSRITYAKYLLITSPLSHAAIANKCGYDDEKYFMRQFRQLTGFTPNKYKDAKHFITKN